MGSYNTAVITTVGQALLTSVLGAQGTMTFTKLQTSSYLYASGTDLSALTSLNNVEQEVNVGSATIVDSTHISAGATISNSGVTTEYNANTLGIFASDGNNEVLFAVSTAVTPDVIPVDTGGTPSTYKYKFTLAVSSTSDITISAVGDIAANDISFDNTTSGLPATEVQTAIDDIAKRLSGQSNRNFIDNAWFTVNQRGGLVSDVNRPYYSTWGSSTPAGYTDNYYKATAVGDHQSIVIGGTTYYMNTADCVAGYTGEGYGFDRWFTSFAYPGIIHAASSGIDLVGVSGTNPGCMIVQKLEAGTIEIGKTYTLSVKADDSIYSATGTIESTSSTISVDLAWIKLSVHLIYDVSLGWFVWVWVTDVVTCNVKSVKLELGSVSTLAYDVAPDYAEELLKCQRYQKWYRFVRTPAINSGVGAYVQVDNPMRATPALTITNNAGGMVTNKGEMASFTGVTVSSFHQLEGDMVFAFTASNPPSAAQDNLCYIYDIRVFADANL